MASVVMISVHRRVSLILTSALLLASCAALDRPPVGNRAVPQPSKAIDLSRYAGTWYEIARYENGFERGCEGVTAEYRLRADGLVQVLNTCRQGEPQGRAKVAKGLAKVVQGSQNAKLKVSFFGPFFGDYWVLDRADDYGWSIVGEPSGRYLWILSRTPNPPDALGQALYARARTLGYDTRRIRPTRHLDLRASGHS
jgi:apolipoprotein D and lipocalin family protein